MKKSGRRCLGLGDWNQDDGCSFQVRERSFFPLLSFFLSFLIRAHLDDIDHVWLFVICSGGLMESYKRLFALVKYLKYSGYAGSCTLVGCFYWEMGLTFYAGDRGSGRVIDKYPVIDKLLSGTTSSTILLITP